MESHMVPQFTNRTLIYMRTNSYMRASTHTRKHTTHTYTHRYLFAITHARTYTQKHTHAHMHTSADTQSAYHKLTVDNEHHYLVLRSVEKQSEELLPDAFFQCCRSQQQVFFSKFHADIRKTHTHKYNDAKILWLNLLAF